MLFRSEPGEPCPDAGQGGITGWKWKPVPAPKLAALSPRRQAWEMTRYQAYQTQLAGHTIGETFARAAAFLKRAAADAPSLTNAHQHATR